MVTLRYTVIPWSHCVTQWYQGRTVLHSVTTVTLWYHGHTLLHSDTVVTLCYTVISWSHCVTQWSHCNGHTGLHSDTMVTLCFQCILCNLQCLSFVVDSSFLWQDFYSTGSKFHHKHDTTRQVSSPNPQCHRSLCQFSWTWWPSREFRKYCNLTARISTGKSL